MSTQIENVVAMERLLNENRRVTYRQIEELLQIGTLATLQILHDHLPIRKVRTLWTPRALTETSRTEQSDARKY